MRKTYVDRQIFGVNILRLWIAVIPLIICMFLPLNINTFGYYKGLLGNPDKITTYEDVKMQYDKEMKSLVSFSTNQVYDLNYDSYKTVYLMVPMQDKLVTVEVSKEYWQQNADKEFWEFEGAVQKLYIRPDVLLLNVPYTYDEKLKIQEFISPYMISCENNKELVLNDTVRLGLIILAVLYFIRRLYCLFVSKNNKVNKMLAQYGDVDRLKQSIDYELDYIKVDKSLTAPNCHLIITKSWFIYTTLFKTIIIPLDEIVWFYKEIVENRRYGISTGKNYYIVISTSTKKSYQINLIDGILEYLHEALPWAANGYSEQLKNLWKSNSEEFIRQVQKRKNENGFSKV